MINTRIMMTKDLGTVQDLEIKCQDYPRDLDGLKPYVLEQNQVGFVASISKKDVGYALCSLVEVPPCQVMEVILGTHPQLRNLGVSKKLMSEISRRAMQEKCHAIWISVPSYKIDDPNDPDYIGWWFESMELKAGHVEDRHFHRYGKWWDAYVFEAVV